MSVEQDAAEYGAHVRHGGWRLGLLVARNVEPGTGNGRPPKDRETRSAVRVSAAEFARLSGTSHQRVLRYLEAWEEAAQAGYVPAAKDVRPEQEVRLPEDDEDGALWRRFYRSNAGRNVAPARRERLEEEAERRGVGPSKVRDIASNPKALQAAIAADQATADAALEALAHRAVRQRGGTPGKRPDPPELQAIEEDRQVNYLTRRLLDAIRDLLREVPNWSADQRRLAAEQLYRAEVADRLALVLSFLADETGRVDDDALVAVLDEWSR